MAPVIRRLRPLVDRFFGVLDSEGVVFFQTLVYTHLAAGGAYCAFVIGGVPESINNALGPVFNAFWLWLCMGVVICLGGKMMATFGHKVWVQIVGLWVQLAGDLAALGAFGGYVVSTIQESTGKPLLAVWVFAALAECAFFLSWRDVRRIDQAERAVRQ
jgi:nitrate/nitrite transporter NarK